MHSLDIVLDTLKAELNIQEVKDPLAPLDLSKIREVRVQVEFEGTECETQSAIVHSGCGWGMNVQMGLSGAFDYPGAAAEGAELSLGEESSDSLVMPEFSRVSVAEARAIIMHRQRARDQF